MGTRKRHLRITAKRDKALAQSSKVITIEDHENADWMHSLPGYKDEAEIINEARKSEDRKNTQAQ